jgi:hypothetical protein
VLLQYLGYRCRQRRLAVIDVTNRPDVHVRLRTIKLFLAHSSSVPFVKLLDSLLAPGFAGSAKILVQ